MAVNRLSQPNAARRARFWLPALLVLPVVFVPCASVRAQDEQDEAVEEAVVAVPLVAQPAFTDQQFDQWVFQQHGTAERARTFFGTQLTLRAEDVDRACHLTDAQKKKLRLAGRGDIKRFFDRYEESKKKFQSLKNDQQKINEIFQDIRPLQMTMMSGLYHEGSFLSKSLSNTLSDEQLARYEAVGRDRQAFRHRAKIELVVAVLEQAMPLTDEQRRKLIELFSKETRPPKKWGQYDYYVILFQISRLPEQRLKPLLDDVQWQVLNQQLNQAKAMEQWLRQSGQLPEDGEED